MKALADLLQVAADLRQHPWKMEVVANAMPEKIELLARVAEVPLFTWTPFGDWPPEPTAQVGILADNSRNKWGVCGNRTGKTETIIFEDICDSWLLDPLLRGPSNRWLDSHGNLEESIGTWCVSDTEETSVMICQKKVADLLGPETGMGWELVKDSSHYEMESGFKGNSIQFVNNSYITFKFSSQKRKAFQGTAMHKIHLDEEPPQDIYSECYARTIDYGGRIAGTFTPVYDRKRGISWIFDELYNKPEKNVSWHNWSLFDNPHLSENAKAELINEWEEDERDVRAYGMFTPMGVKPAMARDLLAEAEKSVIAPREGYFMFNKNGTTEFVEH